MASIFRSSRPMSGALFIENPRRRSKKKSKKSSSRRRNVHQGRPHRRNAWHGEPERHAAAGRKGAQSPRAKARARALRQAIRELKAQGRNAGWAARNRRADSILPPLGGRRIPSVKKQRTPARRAKSRTRVAKPASRRPSVRMSRAITPMSRDRGYSGSLAQLYQPDLPMANPRKRNPRFQPIVTMMKWVGDAQKAVKQVPLAKHLAWALPSLALGYGVYYIHQMVAPRVVPQLERLPYVGGWVSRNPFVSTALLLGPVLGFGVKRGWVNNSAASIVAGAAIVTGVVLDKMAPVAKAQADMGDGMRYLIGQDTNALGPLSNYGDDNSSNYGDASFADAAACPDEMTQQEVSAALSGGRYHEHFPPPPHRATTKGTKYSRHAGLPGHRYGWLIKLVGPARFHELSKLPPQQRHEIIRALKNQALATLSQQLSAAQDTVISAAVPLDGAVNGSRGAGSGTYGALMFAGGG